jgi:hypothetical protein
MHIQFQSEKIKGKDESGDMGINCSIISKQILKKQDVRM